MAGGAELRAAIERLAARPLDSEDAWSFAELRREIAGRLNPGQSVNAWIADALGYRKGPAGSDEGRARKSFMRRLQRYDTEAGERRHISDSELRRLSGAVGSTRAPGTLTRTLQEIARQGVGVADFDGFVQVSGETHGRRRHQSSDAGTRVYVDPAGEAGDWLLDAVEAGLGGSWDQAAELFARAWGVGYMGNSAVVWTEVQEIELEW